MQNDTGRGAKASLEVVEDSFPLSLSANAVDEITKILLSGPLDWAGTRAATFDLVWPVGPFLHFQPSKFQDLPTNSWQVDALRQPDGCQIRQAIVGRNPEGYDDVGKPRMKICGGLVSSGC
jgi:hypothetical protein